MHSIPLTLTPSTGSGGRRRLGLGLLLALALSLALPLVALAHPLGNFSVNCYSRLTLEAGQIQLYYILDMAEVPAFQEQARLDRDGDGRISPAEETAYLEAQVAQLQQNLHLQLNGAPLSFSLRERSLEFPPGQGGLNTLRLSARLVATLTTASLWQADYRDENYAGRLGWQEIVVQAGPGVNLLESSAPAEDLSQELRQYPQDLLQSPLATNQATFSFTPGSGAPGPGIVEASPTLQGIKQGAADPLAALVTIPALGPLPLLLALMAAFGWGAAHALTPGHGKTIVAAYLVGSRGATRHALFLGLTTTLTHTLGVFVLGLLTLFAAEFILPEQLYPWLGLFSGMLVVGLGLSLFRGYLRRLFQPGNDSHHHHDHPHDHDHHHHHDHSHTHLPPGYPGTGGSGITWAGLLTLGVSGGLIPCPSALVVMLSAIALQRIGFGLLLIVAFSLGLAATLTAIGILWVQARRLLERLPRRPGLVSTSPLLGRLRYGLPALSALLITLAGVGITVQAFIQTGLLG